MKYCPYCGTTLLHGAISFCPECGKTLEEASDGTPEPFVISDPPERTEEKRHVEWSIPESGKKKQKQKPYDGYYDDIIPEDGMVHEKPERDKSLALKIVLIVAGVLVIGAICIAVLFLA